MSTETEVLAKDGGSQAALDATPDISAEMAASIDGAETGTGLASAQSELSGDAAGMPVSAESSADMVAAAPGSLLDQAVEFLLLGGPVVWILCAFSVIALTIVLLKLWQFALMRAESSREVEEALTLWAVGDRQGALNTLEQKRPVSALVGLAMHGVETDQEPALLREELSRVATKRLGQMRAFLRPLEVIATLSPLLGLLGTVLGMIVAFKQMEAAGSQVDPSVLSGGIWQALLTTAVGLAVAIPVMTIHNWLERKVERIATLMNDAVTRVFTSSLANENVTAETEVFRHAA